MTHEPYFRWLASYFYAPGYDHDDMLQEARIAAWLAPGHERRAARSRLVDIVRRETLRRPQFVELRDVSATGDVIDLVDARDRLRAVLAAPLTVNERVAVGRAIRGVPICRSEKALGVALWRARRKLAA
jgi:hypothetical protein